MKKRETKQESARQVRLGRMEGLRTDHRRPADYTECMPGRWNGARPCPFVGCRYHMYLDVSKAGTVIFNQPGIDVGEMDYSCAIDLAGAAVGRLGIGAHTDEHLMLSAIADHLSVTTERASQIVDAATIAFATAWDEREVE